MGYARLIYDSFALEEKTTRNSKGKSCDSEKMTRATMKSTSHNRAAQTVVYFFFDVSGVKASSGHT
jgi:hypothetical protein